MSEGTKSSLYPFDLMPSSLPINYLYMPISIILIEAKFNSKCT